MDIIRFPLRSTWASLAKRPVYDSADLEEKIKPILEEVRLNGDQALRKYTLQFDKVELGAIQVSEYEIQSSLNVISPELVDAVRLAAANITAFHKTQVQPVVKVETMPGVSCWRKNTAIQSVGLYIPGGTAPLFSTVLMLVIPALIAGCREIIICTPPGKDGRVHPAILASAAYLGIDKVFQVGGVQAIAAMAYGTETIPKVSKLFGPGNQYVTTAKQLVQKEGVAIDMPAGPSEVAVYADSTANPAFVASDLLSQAEHGEDSQVLLVTDHEPLIASVQQELTAQLGRLPRKQLAERALQNSKMILLDNKEECMELLNLYGPEHLILACADADTLSEKVINAGSVFLGHYSPESAGDYASGTNHTLPTNGYAHAHSGVSVDSFVKKITFQRLTPAGLDAIGMTVEIMAEAEGLHAHAAAVRIRRKSG